MSNDLASSLLAYRATMRRAELVLRIHQGVDAPIPLAVYTSNSYRCVGLEGTYLEVMAPTVHRNGCPDITGEPILRAMVAAFNVMLVAEPELQKLKALREVRDLPAITQKLHGVYDSDEHVSCSVMPPKRIGCQGYQALGPDTQSVRVPRQAGGPMLARSITAAWVRAVRRSPVSAAWRAIGVAAREHLIDALLQILRQHAQEMGLRDRANLTLHQSGVM